MPPRLARRLLRALLPVADRDVVAGDLEEEFHSRRRDSGARAWLWYWGQVVASTPAAVRLRVGRIAAQVPADVRYALRVWRRRPVFAATAVVTQAIGIGVATAVFAVAYAVILRPLPYADADRLVQVLEGDRSGQFSYTDFVDFRRAATAFAGVGGFSGASRTLTAPGVAPERVAAVEVTDGFFEVLGVQPMIGRTFTADDMRRGSPHAVLLTEGAWRRRFGGDPTAIGRSVTLNGQPHTIVGVLPAAFEFPLRGSAEMWLPLRPSHEQEERGYWHWMDVLARPRSDATPAWIDADTASIAGIFAARDAKWHADARLRVVPLQEIVVGDVRPTIEALLAGVLLLLIATSATIAGLLLSRSADRQRELAVRSAVGAGRGRLFRQLLTENVLLALVGGAAGLAAAHGVLRAFMSFMPPAQRVSLPRMEQVGIDPVVAAAGIVLSLVTGVVFGVVPAIRSVRNGRDTMQARTTSGRAENRLRSVLVASQVAVALILLSGAALVGTSVYRLLDVSPGFDPDGLVTMRLTLSEKYAEPAAVHAFHEMLAERLSGIPGVGAVAMIDQAPLTGRGNNGTPGIVGRPLPSGVPRPSVSLRTVSANYFSTMRIPLLRGRGFSSTDTDTSPGVVLVNGLLADQLFAGEDAVGQQITFEFAPGPWRVVGVVGNERFDDLDRPLLPVVYFAQRQDPLRAFTLLVRTSAPAALPAEARRAVAELDPTLPVFAVRTIDQITEGSSGVFLRRTAMWLLATFAGAAVLLAGLALYGVLAQSVAERTREIGIRMALGATRVSVVRLIVRRGVLAVGAGIVAGAIGTVVVSGLLTSLLFAVAPGDPLIVGACAAFLASVALAACLVPAAKATRVDPASAIRAD